MESLSSEESMSATTITRGRIFLRENIKSLLLIAIGLSLFAVVFAFRGRDVSGSDNIRIKNIIMVFTGLIIMAWGFVRLSPVGRISQRAEEVQRHPRRWISFLGGANAASWVAYTILSYGLHPMAPFNADAALRQNRPEFSAGLANSLGFLGGGTRTFLSGNTIFANKEFWLIGYSLPILLSTLVLVALLRVLALHSRTLGADIPRYLFRWAALFACITILALPVLVLDFWYPIGWGRMVTSGINPYYADTPYEFLRGTPLTAIHVRMTYGPLWAAGYSLVMLFAGQRVLLAAMAFKVLLAGAWIGSLRIIWSMLQNHSYWHQALGIAIFGWMPLSVIQTVAEGHNDILMVIFVLLWLYQIDRGGKVRASLSLMASVLIKYVSAPLFVLDFIYQRYSGKQRLIGYIPQFLGAATFAAIAVAPFYRSPDMFAYLSSSNQYTFFSPGDGLGSLALLLGFRLPHAIELGRVPFLLSALFFMVSYIKGKGQERFRKAVLAVMCGMLFGIGSHIWPWYLLWVIAPAALVPGAVLTRWVIGVALAAPFMDLVWVVFPELSYSYVFRMPAIALYIFAVLWLVLAPAEWFFRSEPNTESAAGKVWDGTSLKSFLARTFPN